MRTIYFLDWLSEKSGFTIPQLLEAMKPENQNKTENSFLSYQTPQEFLKKDTLVNYVRFIFNWRINILKKDFVFWKNISEDWEDFVVKLRLNNPEVINFELSKEYYIFSDFKAKKKNTSLNKPKILKLKKI
jgi:hypothetical protein